MRKSGIITIMTAAAILGSAMVAQASPLKDYSAGHVAIDLGYSNPTSLNFTEHGNHGKEGSVYGGATVGIGNKMAVGYKYNQFKSDGDPKVTAQQLNLYYKALPGVSVYGGLVNARTNVAKPQRNAELRPDWRPGCLRHPAFRHRLRQYRRGQQDELLGSGFVQSFGQQPGLERQLL
jgi:hypothetical protein